MDKNVDQYKDKIILITGSTQGIGFKTAILLAQRGAKGIIICGRNEENGNSVKKEIEKIGTKCFYVKTDLENLNECRNLVSKTDGYFGTIDTFINCAGITDRGTILSTSPELFDRIFNINIKAPFFLIQDIIKIMRREKTKGTIGVIITMAAYSGMPFIVAYSASKGALAILIKNLGNTLAQDQIRINALNIGWTDTPNEDLVQKKFHKASNDWLEKAEKKVPFKRLTKPIDVAKGLAFICSSESGIMTGSVIDFDQAVSGFHSYGSYETPVLKDTLIGD
tara:strand:+ start:3783 stop:4622 length:840 start_codon:yes stop_codon:yes gene_type:complete